jgi:hypothetical protein
MSLGIAAQDSWIQTSNSGLDENIRIVAFHWIALTTATPNSLTKQRVTPSILNQIKAALGNTSINTSSTSPWEQQ